LQIHTFVVISAHVLSGTVDSMAGSKVGWMCSLEEHGGAWLASHSSRCVACPTLKMLPYGVLNKEQHGDPDSGLMASDSSEGAQLGPRRPGTGRRKPRVPWRSPFHSC